jgi:hypothetical protein
VGANAGGELLGLGTAALVGAALVLRLAGTPGWPAALATAGAMTLAGTLLEGVIVGTAQWLVLRRPLPRLRWRDWALATAAGACIAWTLGMVPSTLLAATADTGAAPSGEPNDAVLYTLAAAMGLALGPILGVPQWLALRHHVRRAGWWAAANAAAWAVGMPLIFAGIGVAVGDGPVRAALVGGATLAVAGAAVGAVHGLVLIRLLAADRGVGAQPAGRPAAYGPGRQLPGVYPPQPPR